MKNIFFCLFFVCSVNSLFAVEGEAVSAFEGVSTSLHVENVLSGIKDRSFQESYVLMRNFGAGVGVDYTKVFDMVACGLGAKYSFTWHNKATFKSLRGMDEVAFQKGNDMGAHVKLGAAFRSVLPYIAFGYEWVHFRVDDISTRQKVKLFDKKVGGRLYMLGVDSKVNEHIIVGLVTSLVALTGHDLKKNNVKMGECKTKVWASTLKVAYLF